MKINNVMTKEDSGIRQMAWLLILVFSFEILTPNFVHAGGPTQPEVSGFTPIGVSDMVDPFTGDFTYNLPLMNVEGYPLNIAYSGGIGMDQEASWVGLGWNLNVGSVVRNMRGLPDDFSGDEITKVTSMKPNRTYSLDTKFGIELFGKKLTKGTASKDDDNTFKLSASMGISFNNYNGFGVEYSFGPSFSFANASGHSLTSGFSLSGSSENGASFAPSVSFQKKTAQADGRDKTLSGNIGSSFNSRAGLSYVSYGAGMSRAYDKTNKKSREKGGTASGSLSKSASGSYDLGLASYSPIAGPGMKSIAVRGSWKLGADALGFDGTLDFALSYSSQWIPNENKTIRSPGYGYFNLQNGQNKPAALLDFNRDNDGSFTKETPNLPTAYLTYDLFSLSAQGISGSYRGLRNEIGYVFDPEVKTVSTSGGVGIESGMGQLVKLGADISFSRMSAVTGGWDGILNKASDRFRFGNSNFGTSRSFVMQEANESSVDSDGLFTSQLGGSQPAAFNLSGSMMFMGLQNRLHLNASPIHNDPTNKRTEPYRRNQVMQFTSHGDLVNGFGVAGLHPNAYSGAKAHHIGEVVQTGTDGRRYVFGIAAYNHFQEDVSFAIGKRLDNTGGLTVTDEYNGLVNYGSVNGSIVTSDNDYGLDSYYSSNTTPAYAHSFLLTSVLSDDYIDADITPGPSKGDLGSYVKFEYEKFGNYKWRTPIEANSAFRNEGMKTDPSDDKASFVYGEKDLWYVKGIETKNYIAIFTLGNREDGGAVAGRNGDLNSGTANDMKRLEKISLYSRADYELNGSGATPLQEVHFVYSYSLCKGFPGNYVGNGKLTLEEIYFTYQGSKRMKHSPYRFEYGGANPRYNMKAVDRWGNYKPVGSGIEIPNNAATPLNNADFPYTSQNPAETNVWAAAWSMTGVLLPSGGKISVEYESDDYDYVQHKRAMRMFKIVATDEHVGDSWTNLGGCEVHSVSDGSSGNRKIYFKLEEGHENLDEYVTKGSYLYFRCLTDFMNDLGDNNKFKYEYVSGYGKVKDRGVSEYQSQKLGWILFEGEKMKDNGPSDYSPIAKSAIQFGRMHLSRYVSDAQQNDPSDDNSEQGLLSFAKAAYNGLASFSEIFTGPNLAVYNKERGRRIVTNKSWIRLLEPKRAKLGGGIRVKQILMSDNWNAMSGMDSYEYGQSFSYKTADGRSSGVASYEPQAGGDENPWRQPVTYSNKLRFAPDQNLYQEEPIAESQFPSPSVGYSRVEIRDLKREGVVRTATGKVVKEFYTAKDFPTIVKASEKEIRTNNSFLPLLPKYQYLSVSQGFSIELNDMHGKPRRESVYAENTPAPISTVEYQYQMTVLDASQNTHRLLNEVQVVYADGTTGTSEIGVRREAVADFRQSSSNSFGGALGLNLNTILAGPIPIPIPTGWPSIDISENEFKSATLTKVINRFGILSKTIADQDGSKVETSNLAYDAQTGEVLSTRTATNFNDKVYSMNYPAYWKYDQLGQAYKNLEIQKTVTFNNSGFAAVADANRYFVEGDELKVYQIGSYSKGWVSYVGTTGINVIDKAGDPLPSGVALIEVKRSGRRNKQMTSMASLTALTEIIPSLTTNAYRNVLNAGAVEFTDNWKTYCNCFTSDELPLSSNPFILGTKGNLRPVRSYTHLSGRTQSNYDNNTNIRKDGVFSSYTPFYRMDSRQWIKQGLNWTFVSEVTQFSPNGMTLETRDALGRSSASLFGFNNTLTTAVAANTSLSQLANAGFEEVKYSNCMDQQFLSGSNQVVNTTAHTGRHSLRVTAATPVVFKIDDNSCAQEPCNMSIAYVPEYKYQISGGTGPYQLDVEVISGNVNATLGSDGLITIFGNQQAFFELIYTVTDAKGCQFIYTAKKRI